MQSLVGVACLLFAGVGTPHAEIVSQQAASKPVVVKATRITRDATFVIRKPLAPTPVRVLVDSVLKSDSAPVPAPSMPITRIDNARKVVDEILETTPSYRTPGIAKFARQTVTPDADGWTTVRRIARTESIQEVVPAVQPLETVRPAKATVETITENIVPPAPNSVVDTVTTKVNEFIVPDPTDEKFITNARPISVDFQDRLKELDNDLYKIETPVETPLETPAIEQTAPNSEFAVEENIIEEAPEFDHTPRRPDFDIESETFNDLTEVETDTTEILEEQPAVEIEEPVVVEDVEDIVTDTFVDQAITEPAITEAAITEPAIVESADITPAVVDAVIVEPATVEPKDVDDPAVKINVASSDATLLEVIDNWSSIDESTRQSILKLVQADRIVNSTTK